MRLNSISQIMCKFRKIGWKLKKKNAKFRDGPLKCSYKKFGLLGVYEFQLGLTNCFKSPDEVVGANEW